MKIIIKLFLGMVIFVGAIAYFAPASIIEKFLPSNISAAGLSGTLLNGNVQNVIIDKIGLQNTKWTAKPLSLLIGKVQADVSIDSSNIKGDFSTVLRGGLGIFTSRIPFVWPGAMFNNNGLTVGGVDAGMRAPWSCREPVASWLSACRSNI